MVETDFPIKIGLEIHGYLDTHEKLFCMCKTAEGPVNSHICPICTGQPGSKPMLPNKEAVKKVFEIGKVLGCSVSKKDLIWYRKHYNWADLPKGYQNTISGAHAIPCCVKGKFHEIGITECHLEEDPAQWNPDTGRVNYNRSGLPLVEIVTDPDFSSAEEVVEWLKKLVHSLSYIKAIRKNAGIKADVNVSTYGDRAEIKNLNSIENIGYAIEYEVKRQLENYEKGIVQERETLAYNEKLGKTVKMREKEAAQDYRFIQDPDLPVIVYDFDFVKNIEDNLPEMPEVKLEKLISEYGIDKKNAEILTRNLELVEFVEELNKHIKGDVKDYLSWITIELLRILNYNRKTLEDADVEIKPKHLAELIELVEDKKVTPLKAKQVMNDFIPKSFSVKEKGELENLDSEDVDSFCREVIEENPESVSDFKNGNTKSLNFLMGQVMKKANRRADFKVARDCLLRILEE